MNVRRWRNVSPADSPKRSGRQGLLALPRGALLGWRERRARQPVVPSRLFGDRHFPPTPQPGPHSCPSPRSWPSAYAPPKVFRCALAAGDAGGRLVTGSDCALFAMSASRPEDSLGLLPGLVLTWIGITACVATFTTVVFDAAPSDRGGSASVVNKVAARLGGPVAVAALGFASGNTSASALASVAVVEAYRRMMWAAAVLTVVAALTAIAWLSDDHPERCGTI
jgi:hypothetical protein